jgi:succinate dehydrogenase subunit A (EC 1.3.5.1)
MQRVMQANCAVFRTRDILTEGQKLIHEVYEGSADIAVFDRSLVWNTDLMETMEYDNLISQAVVTMDSAANRHRKPRRPCARGLSRIATIRTG